MDYKSYFAKARSQPPSQLVSFYWDNQRLALALTELDKAGSTRLEAIDHFANITTPADVYRQVVFFVDKHHLKHPPCVWILNPSFYQLVLVDQINVAPDELLEATKWKIKDIVHIAVDDLVVDVFFLPPFGGNAQHRKMYAVAAQISRLQPLVELFRYGSDISLHSIDILELALRNLAISLDQSQPTQALITFDHSHSELIILHQQSLYLARHLELRLPELFNEGSSALDTLVLELQRSYDYCESQLGFDAPSHLWLAGISDMHERMISFLQQQLQNTVSTIRDLKTFHFIKYCPSPLPQSLLYAVGGALQLPFLRASYANSAH